MENVLNNLILTFITVGLVVTISYLTKLADAKIKDEKLKTAVDKILQITTLAVNETNQSFVGALKDKGNFEEDDAKKAFRNTKTNIIKMLDKETKEILEKEFQNSDAYINSLIEKQVVEQKKEK